MDLSRHDQIYRWFVLFLATLSFLLLGFVYGWSVLLTPLEADFGWNRAQVTMAYTISMVGLYFGMMLDGVISRKIGNRGSALIGVALFTLGYLLSSRAGSLGLSSRGALWVFYLAYGVLLGLGSGFCYNAWLFFTVDWFPDRSGFASGVAMMGYGFGGLVFAPVVTWFLDGIARWDTILLLTGVVSGVILTAGILLTKPAPRFHYHAQAIASTDSTGLEIPPFQMLRQGAFWFFILYKLILLGAGTSVIGQAAKIVTDAGGSAAFAALCVSFMSVGNGVGRILGGAVVDRIGKGRTMQGVASLMFLLLVCFSLSYALRISSVMIGIMCLFGIGYGSLTTTNTVYVRRVFGRANYKTNMGFNSLTSAPGTFIASSAISLVKTNTGSYLPFFIAMSFIAVIAVITAFRLPRIVQRMVRRVQHPAD